MTTTRRLASALSALAALAAAVAPPPIGPTEAIVFQDDFNSLDLTIWKHELTLSGEGNVSGVGKTRAQCILRVSGV